MCSQARYALRLSLHILPLRAENSCDYTMTSLRLPRALQHPTPPFTALPSYPQLEFHAVMSPRFNSMSNHSCFYSINCFLLIQLPLIMLHIVIVVVAELKSSVFVITAHNVSTVRSGRNQHCAHSVNVTKPLSRWASLGVGFDICAYLIHTTPVSCYNAHLSYIIMHSCGTILCIFITFSGGGQTGFWFFVRLALNKL